MAFVRSQSAVMPRLCWLHLWKCELDAAAVAALFSTDAGRRLEHLSLTWNPLGPEVGRVLPGASCLGNLIELDFEQEPTRRRRVGGPGVCPIARESASPEDFRGGHQRCRAARPGAVALVPAAARTDLRGRFRSSGGHHRRGLEGCCRRRNRPTWRRSTAAGLVSAMRAR